MTLVTIQTFSNCFNFNLQPQDFVHAICYRILLLLEVIRKNIYKHYGTCD